MKTFEKIIDFIANPLSLTVIIAIFLTSIVTFLGNFLPINMQKKFHLVDFYNSWNFIVLLTLLLSFFLIIVQVITLVRKKRNSRQFKKYMEETRNELINDPKVFSILKEMYENHPQPTLLPIYNQKVILLNQYELITRTTNSYPMDYTNLHNPHMPYVLQPVAEKILIEKLNVKE
ncbi:hypothetical protein A6C07_14490 [Listeria monocytogenes]|uniref:super-infection exclusion protein B n=1 Tax=Listeria monocytogenes TaxID=1639 RepID=UPI000BE07840|nr:super-infection exclusion protein B [Listeria monocytogenes]EAA0242916.1 hypothetical protein [Listeria monocytogenes]EAC3779002.1 hypothetical protein [Listeria monocytogenes]EAC8688091.1 hypothetical protein [Listeria monocytogenes]EAD5546839.1 hypothetical protein [Listeria monocytogenes]EAD6963769.1 hypothetical protein [Listeria monocytogenes]